MSKEKEIQALYDALAETLLSATDDEILEECRRDGETPDQVARGTRALLLSGLKDFQQRSLNEAKASYQRMSKQLRTTAYRLPQTTEERRQLLMAVIGKQSRSELVAEFRDFDEMTDDDVESWLEKFAHLGILPHEEDSAE